MSYSRWGSSNWYTYWAATKSNVRDEQIFVICAEGNFTYKQLKTDIKGCLRQLADKIKAGPIPIEEYDFEELEVYIKRFIKDIEEHKDLV